MQHCTVVTVVHVAAHRASLNGEKGILSSPQDCPMHLCRLNKHTPLTSVSKSRLNKHTPLTSVSKIYKNYDDFHAYLSKSNL